MPPPKRYRCRVCGRDLPAWLPVVKRPDGAMLLQHLGARHRDQVGLYLERMRTEDIATVAAEAFEVEEGTNHTWPHNIRMRPRFGSKPRYLSSTAGVGANL
jgi:hypothetical protein